MDVEQTPAAVDGVESGLDWLTVNCRSPLYDLPLVCPSTSTDDLFGDPSGDRLLVGLFVDAPR